MTSGRRPPRRRISVVGTSGSGKSTLAREIASRLDLPCVELDSIHHLPDWEPIEPDEFVRRVGEIASTEEWVIDGNYRSVVRDGPVWERADTVVWLDLPKPVVMRQVVWRTLRRVVTREQLWNGNREPWTNLYRWDPERNIIRWSWTTYDTVVERYERAMADPARGHLDFVRLRSHDAATAWLGSL